jgi:FG-GAP repeat
VYLGSPAGLSASAAWVAENNQFGARFGWSVASAGDGYGDGDLIVGTRDPGDAFVYAGSPSGPSTNPVWSEHDEGAFGYSVATAGDVDGDDYDDVIVGAQLYSHGQATEGRAFVIDSYRWCCSWSWNASSTTIPGPLARDSRGRVACCPRAWNTLRAGWKRTVDAASS